jgi:hypothetical protein
LVIRFVVVMFLPTTVGNPKTKARGRKWHCPTNRGEEKRKKEREREREREREKDREREREWDGLKEISKPEDVRYLLGCSSIKSSDVSFFVFPSLDNVELL